MSGVTVRRLEPALLDDYLRFFDTRAFTDNPRWASCYCYFPYHDPAKTHWPERSGEQNRTAICGGIRKGTAHGYLAYEGTDVVGWCNAGPYRAYPMLADEPVPNPTRTGIVFCFIVAPEKRGHGVARLLLDGACAGFAADGLRYVQARPVRDAASAAANHLGPLAMYLDAGFEIQHEDQDGNVTVRKRVG